MPPPLKPAAHRDRSLDEILLCGFWMIVSASFFAVLVVIVREIGARMDLVVALFFRNLFIFIFFIPAMIRAGIGELLSTELKWHAIRGAVMVASSILLFHGLAITPIAEATALGYTSTLFAFSLAVLVLGERVTAQQVVTLLIGFAGVLIILRPGLAVMRPGSLLILASSAIWAIVIVIGRHLAPTAHPWRMVLYMVLFTTPLSFAAALLVWEWPDLNQLFWCATLGLVFSLNMYAMSQALRISDASLAMQFDFVKLLIVGGFGFFIYGEMPDIYTILGAVVILGSAIAVVRIGRKRTV